MRGPGARLGANGSSRGESGLDLFGAVNDAIARHELLRPGDRVLVAVSGGPDSMALLHLLVRLSAEGRFDVHAFHLDHALRQESAEDAAFVQATAEKWRVPVTVVRRNVQDRRRPGESLQQAARRVRYGAMRRVAREVGASRIAIGHHADDQAETVLIRLLRGSGGTGLGGMRPRRGPFIRPLLEISRDDIVAYCRAFKVETREDPSNLSVHYLRNKVRLRLMPLLAAEYNPNIRLTLNRTAALLRDDDDLLELLAYKRFQRLQRDGANRPPAELGPGLEHLITSGPIEGAHDIVSLPTADLRREPTALQRRIVRHALRAVTGTLLAVTYEHIQAVLDLLDNAGGAVSLPGKVLVRRQYDVLVFRRTDASAQTDSAARNDSIVPTDAPAPIDCVAHTDASAQTDSAAPTDPAARIDSIVPTNAPAPIDSVAQTDAPAQTDSTAQTDPVAQTDCGAQTDSGAQSDPVLRTDPIPLIIPGRTFVAGNTIIDAAFIEPPPAGARPAKNEAWLDWEKLSPPLVVRRWRPGDRMRPMGLGGTKKLQDIFVDEKVPAVVRRHVPIVADRAGIIWLAALRTDERVAVGPDSRRVLQLRIASL